MTEVNKTKSPLLIPYPSVEANTVSTGAGGWPPRLISATRVRADACDRLWVMDCGTVELLTPQPKRMAPPKIVVFDLKVRLGGFPFPIHNYFEKSSVYLLVFYKHINFLKWILLLSAMCLLTHYMNSIFLLLTRRMGQGILQIDFTHFLAKQK